MDVITFPSGLPGFSGETTFLVLQRPEEYPLAYLQSTRTPHLCFLTIPILAVDQRYSLHLSADDAALLDTPEQPQIGQDVLCLALIAMRDSGPVANLFAPLVVNLATRTGVQCFNRLEYSHRHPLTTSTEGVAA